MGDEVQADTYPLTIGGREVLFRRVSPGMLIAARRYVKQALKNLQDNDDFDPNDVMFDIIDSRFVNPEDQDWVAKQMMIGAVDISEILPVLSNGVRQQPVPDDDDAEVEKPKKAGRKAAAKKAVKKTANPARARR